MRKGVKEWHGGKIVLLWGLWALVFTAWFISAPRYLFEENPAADIVRWAVFAALFPAWITWRWLSARERPPSEQGAEPARDRGDADA